MTLINVKFSVGRAEKRRALLEIVSHVREVFAAHAERHAGNRALPTDR